VDLSACRHKTCLLTFNFHVRLRLVNPNPLKLCLLGVKELGRISNHPSRCRLWSGGDPMRNVVRTAVLHHITRGWRRSALRHQSNKACLFPTRSIT